MQNNKVTVHIEFISDYICPWCYIGKARLGRVKELVKEEIDLEIEVKPFLLYPKIPKGGVAKEVFAKKTKLGMGRSLKMEAAAENLTLSYQKIERIPASFEAHRLTTLVETNLLKFELAKRIFYGYFEEGADIENHDFLIDQAKSVGVEKKTIGEFFATDAGKLATEEAIKASKNAFISVVPTMRLDHQFVVPGLQSIDVWENYIRRAAEIQKKAM